MPNDIVIKLIVRDESKAAAFFASLAPLKLSEKDPMRQLGRTRSSRVDFNRVIPVAPGDDAFRPDTRFPEPHCIVIQKWGTKWNAYDDEEGTSNTIVFHTAWTYPAPVMDAIARAHEDVDFVCEWADGGSDIVNVVQYTKGRMVESLSVINTSDRGREIAASLGVTVFEDEDDDDDEDE